MLAGTTAGRLQAFALADGAVEWQMELNGRLRGLGSDGDRLYVGTIDGTLYALETVVQDTRATPASQEDRSGPSDGQR